MTEYDIQRTAKAVVDLLLIDDRFLTRIQKLVPKRSNRVLSSKQAADLLGVSTYTIRHIAPYIGGVKGGSDKYQHWSFEEDGLKERFIEYRNSK